MPGSTWTFGENNLLVDPTPPTSNTPAGFSGVMIVDGDIIRTSTALQPVSSLRDHG